MTTSGQGVGLKSLVSNRILNEILRCESVKRQTKTDWKVLVMDQLTTRIISAACKMHDIMAEGITIVEDIFKDREPLPDMEAVYFISPSTATIDRLIADFEQRVEPLYKAAHIFFTQACDDENFNRLSKSKVARYSKTLKEINIAFIPYEKQVFTLDYQDGLNMIYSPTFNQTRAVHLETIAEQIATLCVSLREYPRIRYRCEFVRNAEFGHILQSKLDQYKAEDPSLGEGIDKSKSVLLILDRGFDVVTAVIHDLTLQAMTYDLLELKDDVYTFRPSPVQKPVSGSTTDAQNSNFTAAPITAPVQKDVILTDGNDLWIEIRHKHIASASQIVTKRLKEFAAEKHIKETGKSNIKDLGQLVKKLPQYQKELTTYSVHLQLIEDCMKYYQGKLDKICIVEQNLVTGVDADGEKIKDHMKHIVTILLDNTVSVEDKLRVIVLYILHKNGINEENLDKLLSHAMIPSERRELILKLQLLNLQIIHDAKWNSRKKNIPPVRADRNDAVYQTARWTPYVKDLMEAVINDKLDSRTFPTLGHRNPKVESVRAGGQEYGGWYRGRNQSMIKSGPRLIVFVIGGLTYPEMRCAYEVTSSCAQNVSGSSGISPRKWDVIIGSDHIITPNQFLDELNNVSSTSRSATE